MECKVKDIIALGDGPGAGNLVLAEIICLHINESVFDGEGRIMQDRLDLVARMGGDLYTRATAENIFTVPKPIMQQGMGIDNLPEYVRNSPVLTGNDLAQLANVTQLPRMDEVEEYVDMNPAITEELDYLRPFPASRVSYIHQRSRSLLRKGQLAEAWLNLMAGEHYEEQLMNDLINTQS